MSQTEDFGQNKSKETKLMERGRGRAPSRSPPWRRRPAALFPPHGPGGRGAAVGAKRRPAAATAGSGGSRGSPQPSGEGKREEGARANQSHRPKGEAARRRRRPSVWRPLTAEAAGSPPLSPGSLPHSPHPPPPSRHPPPRRGCYGHSVGPGGGGGRENGGQGGGGGVCPPGARPRGGHGGPALPPGGRTARRVWRLGSSVPDAIKFPMGGCSLGQQGKDGGGEGETCTAGWCFLAALGQCLHGIPQGEVSSPRPWVMY